MKTQIYLLINEIEEYGNYIVDSELGEEFYDLIQELREKIGGLD